MGSWMRDLRVGARSLLRRPGFTLGVAITLGLGIGATTTVYSIVDGVLIRPLPYDEASALVAVGAVSSTQDAIGRDGSLQGLTRMSMPNFIDLREQARSFESLAAIEPAILPLTDAGDGPEIVSMARVTPDLFRALGVSPAIGRTFLAEEFDAGSSPVVMLSYGAWQSRYGGDPNIVGRLLERAQGPTTVVGVLPRDFRPPEAYFSPDAQPEIWSPLADDGRYDRRDLGMVHVVGRLATGATVQSARAEAERIATGLASRYPDANVRPDGARLGIASTRCTRKPSARRRQRFASSSARPACCSCSHR